MPRKEIETAAASWFGSETTAKVIRILLERDGQWIQQAELAKSAGVDSRTIQRLVSRLSKSTEMLQVDKPFKNVKLYRIEPDSDLARGLKMIFEELE